MNDAKFHILELNQAREYIYMVEAGDDTTKTITQDIENVLQKIFDKYLENFGQYTSTIENVRVLYKDADGNTDEILHDNGTFIAIKKGYEGIESRVICNNCNKKLDENDEPAILSIQIPIEEWDYDSREEREDIPCRYMKRVVDMSLEENQQVMEQYQYDHDELFEQLKEELLEEKRSRRGEGDDDEVPRGGDDDELTPEEIQEIENKISEQLPKINYQAEEVLILHIDLKTGKILNWPEGVSANINVNALDGGEYLVNDEYGNTLSRLIQQPVPKCLCINQNHDGETINIEINNGVINNWQYDLTEFLNVDEKESNETFSYYTGTKGREEEKEYYEEPNVFYIRFNNTTINPVTVNTLNNLFSFSTGKPVLLTAEVDRNSYVLDNVKGEGNSIVNFNVAAGESCVFRMTWNKGLFSLNGVLANSYAQIVNSCGYKLSGNYDIPQNFMQNLFNNCPRYNQSVGDIFDTYDLIPTSIGDNFMNATWNNCSSMTNVFVPDTTNWKVDKQPVNFMNATFNSALNASNGATIEIRGNLYIKFQLMSNGGGLTNGHVNNVKVDADLVNTYRTHPNWTNINPSKFIAR